MPMPLRFIAASCCALRQRDALMLPRIFVLRAVCFRGHFFTRAASTLLMFEAFICGAPRYARAREFALPESHALESCCLCFVYATRRFSPPLLMLMLIAAFGFFTLLRYRRCHGLIRFVDAAMPPPIRLPPIAARFRARYFRLRAFFALMLLPLSFCRRADAADTHAAAFRQRRQLPPCCFRFSPLRRRYRLIILMDAAPMRVTEQNNARFRRGYAFTLMPMSFFGMIFFCAMPPMPPFCAAMPP